MPEETIWSVTDEQGDIELPDEAKGVESLHVYVIPFFEQDRTPHAPDAECAEGRCQKQELELTTRTRGGKLQAIMPDNFKNRRVVLRAEWD